MNISSYLNKILTETKAEDVVSAFISAVDILNTDHLVDITPEKAIVTTGVIGKTIRKGIARILYALSQYTPNVKTLIVTQEEYDSATIIFDNVLYLIRKPGAVLLVGLDEYLNYDPSKHAYVTSDRSYWATVRSKLLFSMNTYRTELFVGSEYDLDRIQAGFFEDSNLAIVKLDLASYEIEPHAFCNCKELRQVYLGSGVNEISSTAFKGCNHIAIMINKAEGSIDGAPWGAENANVIWLG